MGSLFLFLNYYKNDVRIVILQINYRSARALAIFFAVWYDIGTDRGEYSVWRGAAVLVRVDGSAAAENAILQNVCKNYNF